MAAFPATQKYEWRGLQQSRKSVVERYEMERGIAKQRRIASDTVVSMELTMHFDTLAAAVAFERTWFDVTINAGQDYFDFTDPVGNVVVQARCVGGLLGPLMPKTRTFSRSTRTMMIEFTRSAL